MQTTNKSFKSITKLFTPPLVPEGDGVFVHRVIGTKNLPRLDPFLLLDYASFKLPAGTPDHPHRGFETVSYITKGTIHHEDFLGNKGTLNTGDCQWMTAGKGIMHSEMPGSFEEETTGFQLWINLAAKDKLCKPGYQEVKSKEIPVGSRDGVTVKVISGESLGVKGPIIAKTPATYLDVRMDKNTKFEQVIPKEWNAFSFLYEGEALFGEQKKKAETNSCIVFKQSSEEQVVVVETGDHPVKFLLIAGQPLNEPVFHYGPFVLSSEEDLRQAFVDYQNGQNGFENALTWESKNKDLALKKRK